MGGKTIKLLAAFLQISSEVEAFSQQRTERRAQRLWLSVLLCLGRKWITRLITTANRDQQDWSGDYKVFNRSQWAAKDLFTPVVRHSLDYNNQHDPIVIAGDETKLKRAGKRVKLSSWLRDPLSPPFRINLIKGIRFVQFSVLLPLHRRHGVAARAVPVSFEPVNIPRKPRKNSSPEEKAAYKKAKLMNNMCKQALRQMRVLRQQYDRIGAAARLLLFVLDGGFCNRTIFKEPLERIRVLARCRKDAKLCFPCNDPLHPKRIYSPEKFTPESVRTNNAPWRKQKFFIGGKKRPVRFKERSSVLWQRGAGLKPLRLIVLAPIPYRLSVNSKVNYRQPAFFLCDDLDLPIELLIQAALDRWQIEVNHRDEKQHIGIGHPQVWNDRSVDRLPAFMVAAYSFLLLASLQAYGAKRTDDYLRPPKWQHRRRRPSCLDLLSQLRKEAFSHPELLQPLDIDLNLELSSLKAAA
jgi:hypothetical protein